MRNPLSVKKMSYSYGAAAAGQELERDTPQRARLREREARRVLRHAPASKGMLVRR